jgi:hypothetical protein
VKDGEVSVTSKKGNEIKKQGDENDPAVAIERSGNDVVKKASELTVEGKGEAGGSTEEEKNDTNGESGETEKNKEINQENKPEANDTEEKEDVEMKDRDEKTEEEAEENGDAKDEKVESKDNTNGQQE